MTMNRHPYIYQAQWCVWLLRSHQKHPLTSIVTHAKEPTHLALQPCIWSKKEGSRAGGAQEIAVALARQREQMKVMCGCRASETEQSANVSCKAVAGHPRHS